MRLLLATAPVAPGADAGVGELLLELLRLTLPLRLNVGLRLTHHAREAVDDALELVDAGAELAPLLLAKDAVGGPVNEEHLLLLRQAALDQLGADHVNGPHLDVLGGDLKRVGDVLVGDLAVGRAGGEGGEGQEAHLALELLVVELLLLDPTLVLVSEVVVVLEVLLGEDVEQLGVHGLRVVERLHRGEDAEVLEVEAAGRGDGHAEGAERELLGLLRGDLFLVVAVERAEGLEEKVVRLPGDCG